MSVTILKPEHVMQFSLTTSRPLILKKRLQRLFPSISSVDRLDHAGVTVYLCGRLVSECAALASGALHAVVYTNVDAQAFLSDSAPATDLDLGAGGVDSDTKASAAGIAAEGGV